MSAALKFLFVFGTLAYLAAPVSTGAPIPYRAPAGEVVSVSAN